MAKNISIKMSTMMKTRSEMDDEDAGIQRERKKNRHGGRVEDRQRSAEIGTIRAPTAPTRPSPRWSKPGSDESRPFLTVFLNEMSQI